MMSRTLDAYRRILLDVFGAYLTTMPEMTEADWVEFSRDMEASLGMLPIQARNDGRTVSLAAVLIMRGRGMRLKEVAGWVGRSQERVRQLQAKALRLMRHPDRSTRLAKWVVRLSDE